MKPTPTVIDIARTAEQFAKWALMEFLFLIGLILFGLSAPFLFTVGIEILAFRAVHSDMRIWAPVYFLTAPFACAIWMVFICYSTDPKFWRAYRKEKAGEIASWRQDFGGRYLTLGKAVWFMFSGLVGSVVAEVIFCYGLNAFYPDQVNPRAYPVVFAILPFFAFSPVLLVLVSRWIRRDRHAATV